MHEGWQERLEKFGLSLYMIRVTLAATLSWLAVNILYGDRYLYFAPLAAILITQGTVKASLEKGVYRLLGIVLGGMVSLLVGRFMNVGIGSIMLILLIGIGVATACKVNIQAISQAGVTSVMTLTFYHDHYIEWRLAETVIGVLIALLINMIIVPPKGFVKAKAAALEGSLLLADALSGLHSSSGIPEDAQAVLARSGKLLGNSENRQKELLFTLSHCSCHKGLRTVNRTTAHLKKLHAYASDISEELALLPPRYAASEGMREALAATADCIALYGAGKLSAEGNLSSLPEALNRARELQLAEFSKLQAECPVTAVRELGAVFSRLNRVLVEIERTGEDTPLPVPQPVRSPESRRSRTAGKTAAGHRLQL